MPDILLMENVPEVIGFGNVSDFNKWQFKLEKLGYKNTFKVLNAKKYGIPQNRRRCFMISILGDYSYLFPQEFELKYKLKDLLEKQVDEKYYLSDAMLNYLQHNSSDKYDRKARFNDSLEKANKESMAVSITTRQGRGALDNYIIDDKVKENNYLGMFQYVKSDAFMGDKDRFTKDKEIGDTLCTQPKEAVVLIKNATKQGYLEAKDGDGVDISGRMETHRGTVQNGLAQTIKTQNDVSVVVKGDTLKKELCNKLIQDGKVKEFDIVRHSYTKQRLKEGDNIRRQNNISTALETRCDCIGVVVYSETEKQLFTKDGNIKRYLNGDKVDEFKEGQMATTTYPNGYGHGPRTHNESIALNTIDRPSVKSNLRIRKLVPIECMKLMAFERKDYDAMRNVGLSDQAIYHCAGDSICVNVLIGIFGKLFMNDPRDKIKEYIEGVVNDRR